MFWYKSVIYLGKYVYKFCSCTELYGFDILIDENLKPWLLEVNLSPSLNCDSPLDVRLKSAMLADLLTLVGIPAVDPVLRPSTSSMSKSQTSSKVKLGSVREKYGMLRGFLTVFFFQYRRVHSADGLSNTIPRKQTNSYNKIQTTATQTQLSPDEVKLVKIVNAQFERRGGFVRIFPTIDSWAKYSQYLGMFY